MLSWKCYRVGWP